jgi:3-oxoacyl-[acyl-carrier protein] reductase
MDLGLSGKSALVTGGSRGIGRATALTLAREGCKVAICARGQDTLDATLKELADVSPNVWGTTADVTSSEDVERFVSEAAENAGGIDIVVCNVGGSSGGGILDATDEEWMATLDLNLLHSVRVIRAVAPLMKEGGGGSVVMVSSISGWKPGPGAQYGTAKASEIFLASSLALELAPLGIRVNTVSPGSIMFPGGGWDRYQQSDPEGMARFLDVDLPTHRLGTDQEIADVIAFISSDRASWVNGANIPVDGAQARPTARWYDHG